MHLVLHCGIRLEFMFVLENNFCKINNFISNLIGKFYKNVALMLYEQVILFNRAQNVVKSTSKFCTLIN